MSTRRPIVTHPSVKSRGVIQNLVTYHTKRRYAIKNHVKKKNRICFFACTRTHATAPFFMFRLKVDLPRT
jgi:hypothetical protein